MKHYINKQSPKQSIIPPDKAQLPAIVPMSDNQVSTDINTEDIKAEDEEVVFPPDIDVSVYDEGGVKLTNYQADICKPYDFGDGIGGAISQRGGFKKQETEDAINKGYIEECSYMSRIGERKLFPHNMGGKFNFLSVPATYSEPAVVSSMISLLDKYKGKYVCLDLWNAENIRIEKCGYLEAAEEGYILVRGNSSDELTMINLSTIKYINIYCR